MNIDHLSEHKKSFVYLFVHKYTLLRTKYTLEDYETVSLEDGIPNGWLTSLTLYKTWEITTLLSFAELHMMRMIILEKIV